MRLRRKTLIEVGIFVTLALAATFLAVFMIGRGRGIVGKTYTLRVAFDDVSGLRQGAQVQLAGLNVGYVDGVRFSGDSKSRGLDVILKISVGFKEFIRQDSTASIQTQGLLGDKYILITRGRTSSPVLNDGESLQSEGIGGLSAMAAKGSKMMDEVALTAQRFRKVLEKLSLDEADEGTVKNILAEVEGASADLHTILSGMKEGEGTIGALLKDPALYHDLRALMGRANRSKLLKNLIRATISEQEKATTQPLP